MSKQSSRRRFLQTTGGAYVAVNVADAVQAGQANEAPGSVAGIESEIRRRAEACLGRRYLVVDYYRIRRQLAYRLPVESLSVPSVPVPTISDYPWATWMLWALEERVNSLGWAAEWSGNAAFARSAARDLEALSAWPKYCQYAQPDLSSGHAGRLLWIGFTKWRWPDAALRQKMRAACARHVEEVLPLTEQFYGALRSKQDFLALPAPEGKLVNIPLIGTVTAALTAHAAGHPAATALNQRVLAILGAILELRNKGYSEAAGYDGYILDFVADWLETLPAGERQGLLDHPNLKHYLEESYMLSVPGAAEQLAELSDVEPREMPFHYSAQAKLAHFQADPTRAWLLQRWPVGRIRADGLGALHEIMDRLRPEAPRPGTANAHYAVVLRSGWEKDELAVAASCTTSQASHVQADNGTLLIGTRARWIVCDPGYQQYMRGEERDFTIGPAAHNYPLINGMAQNRKASRLVRLDEVEPGLLRTDLELGPCYPDGAKVRSVMRTVWLGGRDAVVVGDRIEGDGIARVTYHWHGHPEAAWWAQDGWALLHLPDADLWCTSPQASLSGADILRLPGSRGQLTLAADVNASAPVIWWVFAIAAAPPRVDLEGGGRTLRVAGRRFEL